MAIELRGTLLASDSYGRLRLLVGEAGADGKKNPTWGRLCRAGAAAPASPDAEGDLGVVAISAPKGRRAHWLAFAAANLDREVRLEADPRGYVAAGRRGVALDLRWAEPAGIGSAGGRG